MTAWLPDVVPDQTIESVWGNTIRDRTVTPFANAAARTAAIATPKVGQLSWIVDTKRLDIYDGTAWRALPMGDLGYAQITANSGIFPLTATLIPGLRVDVAAARLPAGRVVQMTLCGLIDVTGTTNAANAMRVNGTQIGQANIQFASAGNGTIFGQARYIATGVAAAFEVASWQQVNQNAKFIATATYPTWIQVTDIGAV